MERAAALRDLKLLVGNLDICSLLRGCCYMETWRRLLQDATTNGLGDHEPKSLYNRNFTVTGMSMSCLDRARTANFGPDSIIHTYGLSDLFMSRMSLQKACLNKHVEQISFRQFVTSREHPRLKGWQPHFQPTEAKSFLCNNSWSPNHNFVTKPSASLHETGLFSAAVTKGWA